MRLRSYQVEILNKALGYSGYALFMKMRTGKTPIAIAMIRRRKAKTLVVAPLPILDDVWMREIKRWGGGGLFAVNGRRELVSTFNYESGPCVYIINYEALKKIPYEELKKFDMIVLDESHKIKGVKSKISKHLRSIAHLFKYRLILTGTPAPNTILEYWPQINFLHPYVLNPEVKHDQRNPHADKYFYRFRGRHFYSYGYGGYQWTISKEESKEVMKRIKKCSVFMSKEDCLDLPPTDYAERFFELDVKARKVYTKLEKDFVVRYKGSVCLAQNELVEIMKLRQITSGFFIGENGLSTHISDSKLRMLEEILDEIGNEQVVIWTQFDYEVDVIQQLITNLGKTYSTLQGGISDVKRTHETETFKSGKSNYLIAHPKTASLGLDFSIASYDIFYSQSYSLLEWEQASSRLDCDKSNRKVTHINILAKGTIDETIYKALLKKEQVSTALLTMLKR